MEVQHKIVMSQVMLPHQANVAGNVHGGEIMKFMDMAAAAVAMKFSKGNCVMSCCSTCRSSSEHWLHALPLLYT